MAGVIGFVTLAALGGSLLYIVASIGRWLAEPQYPRRSPVHVVVIEEYDFFDDDPDGGDPDGGQPQDIPDNVVPLHSQRVEPGDLRIANDQPLR
ncbi:hypothetical protein [Candidatus Poriferisodalis sp.]|uniref:hypothetical protein n=1 Tax=Candidatus Poriferisodalis sp. TaxID=3101277 RepID=UPI003B01D854